MSSWFTRKNSPSTPPSSPGKWNKLNKAMNNSSKKICLYSDDYVDKIKEILIDHRVISYHDDAFYIELSNISQLLTFIQINIIITQYLSDNYLLDDNLNISSLQRGKGQHPMDRYEDPAQRFKDWVTLSHSVDNTVKMALDAAFSRNTNGLNAKQKMDIMSKLQTAKREFCTEARMKSLQNSLPEILEGGKRTRRKHHKTRKHRR